MTGAQGPAERIDQTAGCSDGRVGNDVAPPADARATALAPSKSAASGRRSSGAQLD
jgi:hypothetical protein